MKAATSSALAQKPSLHAPSTRRMRNPRVRCSQCTSRPEILDVEHCDKCDTKNICPNCHCNCLTPLQRAVENNKIIRVALAKFHTKVRLLEVISKDRQYTEEEQEELDTLNRWIGLGEDRLNRFAVQMGLADEVTSWQLN